jgi:hypothetical protein
MAYCENCGKELREGSSFCPNCGTAIVNNTKSHVEEQPIIPNKKGEGNKRKLFKKKKFWIIAVLVIIVLFLMCLGDDYHSEMKPQQTTIQGPLGEFFEVVDRTYEVDDSYGVYIEFRRIKKGMPAPWVEGMEVGIGDGTCRPEFRIEVKDEKGNIQTGIDTDIVFDEESLNRVVALAPNETAAVHFDLKQYVGFKSTFKISSSFKVNEDKTEKTSKSKPLSPLEVILPSALKGSVEITHCGKVTEGEFGFPEVEIGFKLLKTVETSSLASSYGQLWIVGVGLDEDGRNVKELLPNYEEWRTHDGDGSEFKAFLESDPGETINMTFVGGKEGDVSEGISKVAKFKLKITN